MITGSSAEKNWPLSARGRNNMAHITLSDAIARITAQATSGGSLQKRSRALPALEPVRSIGGGIYLLRNGKQGIIAPADDTLQPIIGECDQADWTLEMPPCLTEWLDGYNQEVEWLQKQQTIEQRKKVLQERGVNPGHLCGNSVAATQAQASPKKAATVPSEAAGALTSVTPLIATKWNQTAPWNQNLTLNGEKCLVGCVPISIGQLLYYWATKGFRRGCTASKAYKTKTNGYEIDALPPVTVFDYEHMVTGKPASKAAKKAVADMLEHIGKAVKADYKPSATGTRTDDYQPALKSAFRLGDNITSIYASKLGLEAFSERIRKELMDGRPVMMTGCNSAYTAAHSFLCDGYQAIDNKFHFNWGWGGSYNGWFKMGALTPTSSRNYSYYKHAFIGICPAYQLGDANRSGVVDISDVLTAADKAIKGEYAEESDVNSDGKVDIKDAATIADIVLGKL